MNFKIQTLRHMQSTIPWNLVLITIGGILFAIGVNGVALHHGFMSGGLFGTGMLAYYATGGMLSPTAWYMLMNIPVFVMGWFFVSKRFFWYSIYGFISTSIATEFLTLNLGVQNHLLAAIATGIICGAGVGVVLHSLGSDGGLTIISIILHQRYNIRVGQVNFVYNLFLFGGALAIIHVDRVIYSLIIVALTSSIMERVLSMFNQRKMILIVSDESDEIANAIMKHLKRGVTMLEGRGAFTNNKRSVILTVVQNYQVKRLEELAFAIDEDAFVIIENTFNVLGSGFSARKQY